VNVEARPKTFQVQVNDGTADFCRVVTFMNAKLIRAATGLVLLLWSTAPASASAPDAVAQSGARSALAHAFAGQTTIADSSEDPDLVVLIHGLGRTKLSMLPLEWTLERAGYEVLNWGYRSTCCSISELAASLAADLDRVPDLDGRRVHFVGHSLGAIVVRALLASDPPERLGRVVMLAPPNRGSEAANRFAPHFGWLLRPLPEITTGRDNTIRRLSLPEAAEIGVVAGRFDGKVSVEESHLAGETDHVIVPSAHTFIMARSDVRRLVIGFLGEGRFPRNARTAHPAGHYRSDANRLPYDIRYPAPVP
jgi:triacylglycerol lipase